MAVVEESFDPLSHPLVCAARKLLQEMRSLSDGEAAEPMEGAAFAAYGAASCGAMGDHASSAVYRAELPARLGDAETRFRQLALPLHETWSEIIACRMEGDADAGAETPVLLGRDDVEELVLAALTAYPPFLADALPRELLRRVSLGQGLLRPDERHIDLELARQELEPRLYVHHETATRVAAVCCEHLVQRSDTLAVNMLRRLDLDQDGSVSEDDFMRAAPCALMIEVEDVALSAGVEAMLADPAFADDFHTSVAAGLGNSGDVDI